MEESLLAQDSLTEGAPQGNREVRHIVDVYIQLLMETPHHPLPGTDRKKNYSYALKFSILDLNPKVTFLFLN